MAIFSLNLRSIGRSTQKAPFSAAAALRYIGRKTAATVMVGEHMPTCMPGNTKAAEAWFRAQENADRRNARVADRIIIALPLELDHAAQVEAVTMFMHRLGNGRVPWSAGLHNGPKDVHNPHAHLLVRDRDITTGKRMIGLSEKNATNTVRAIWAAVCNEALRTAGVAVRIDHRSNKQRVLDLIPGVHVGQKLPRMPTPPEGEETRMTINKKINAANAATEAARAMRESAHNMAVGIAEALADERSARLAAETELGEERKRRKAAESKLQLFVHEATQQIRNLRDLIGEARGYVRALSTRVSPSKIKPSWLDNDTWQVFQGVLRFRPTATGSGGIERGALPTIKRQNER
jgi:hypothetical protein